MGVCCCYLQFLEGDDIVDILEILGFGGAKGDDLLGEISEEKAHKRLSNG